jgi:hypothetical protein
MASCSHRPTAVVLGPGVCELSRGQHHERDPALFHGELRWQAMAAQPLAGDIQAKSLHRRFRPVSSGAFN